jgi:type VI secretion system secreted protein Hcp
MSNAYYLKFGDIKGECVVDKHKDEIEVLSWNWGASNPPTIVGSGMSAGKVTMSDLSISKRVDKASLKLLEYCISGKHVTDATLACAKSTGGKTIDDFFSIKLGEAYISSYQVGGSAGEDVGTESLSIAFRSHEADYKEQKKDGSLQSSVHHKFDHLAHKLE